MSSAICRVDVTTFCAACATWTLELRRDRAGRLRGCPACLSLERHRVLGILLPALASSLPADPIVLDVAPSRALDGLLAGIGRVVRIDFDPAADGRLVDVRASLTAIPLSDASVDLVVCSHVLEHVPDDRAALRELARVMAPRGIGVVLVPWRAGPTDEDPDADADERVRRFGQADHVRYYGDDFTDRLATAGLTWTEFTAGDIVDSDTLALLSAVPHERLWIVRSGAGEPTPESANLASAVRSALLTRLIVAAERSAGLTTNAQDRPPSVDQPAASRESDEVRAAREQAARAEQDAERAAKAAAQWQNAYTRLRTRRSVRTMAFAGRLLRTTLPSRWRRTS